MQKIKASIIGSGNIGADLMYKLERSDLLKLTSLIGIDEASEGIKLARERGYSVFTNGVQALIDNPDIADIIFDATSAQAHIENAKEIKTLGKTVIDLTPAAIGPFLCPVVNLNENLDKENINMITCGGQATIPIVHAINKIANVNYAEIVATISSKSAGPGTRANIDEFTDITKRALEEVGGARRGKAIIILNPAEPPIVMRNTIYCEVKKMDKEKILQSIYQMINDVQEYVPGYHLKHEPIITENRVTVMLEIEGAGDYLPRYAGNLDIMTAAAVRVGEQYAKEKYGIRR